MSVEQAVRENRNEYMKKWREKNRDKIREKRIQYEKENPDIIRACQRRRREREKLNRRKYPKNLYSLGTNTITHEESQANRGLPNTNWRQDPAPFSYNVGICTSSCSAQRTSRGKKYVE